MSVPSSVLEAQLKSLLELVEGQRAEECSKLEADARQRGADILREAHRQARERMHEAIATERQRTARQLESTRAHLRTRSREHQHKVALLMLHRGWEALREALISRWREPRTQAEWCNNLMDKAITLLPAGHWNIEHPSGWRKQAARSFADTLERATGYAPTLSPDSDVSAGLRICCGASCLDGTIGEPGVGLLTDRPDIEARLLAHLHHIMATRENNGGNGQ